MCAAAPKNAMTWLCEHGVQATYCTSSLLQVNLQARKCEEYGCQKFASFGYPGGRPVRCGTHRLSDMVGRAALVLRIPWDCRLRLHSHAVRCSIIWCGSVGGCDARQMRSRWLPQVRNSWLPRRQASAVWHAQARQHGAAGFLFFFTL